MKLLPIERKSDGSLPRMTDKQQKSAIKLINKVCPNYDGSNCIILAEGDRRVVCAQSISYFVNCKYFRWVLLEEKGLSLKAEIFPDNTKKCTICGKVFQSTGNRAKYCSKCAKNMLRKQQAKYARNKRGSGVEK